jgi:hypothetical protein
MPSDSSRETSHVEFTKQKVSELRTKNESQIGKANSNQILDEISWCLIGTKTDEGSGLDECIDGNSADSEQFL